MTQWRREGRRNALLLFLSLALAGQCSGSTVPVVVPGTVTFTTPDPFTFSIVFPTNTTNGSVTGFGGDLGGDYGGGGHFLGTLATLSHNVYSFTGGSGLQCASTQGTVVLVSGTATPDPSTWTAQTWTVLQLPKCTFTITWATALGPNLPWASQKVVAPSSAACPDVALRLLASPPGLDNSFQLSGSVGSSLTATTVRSAFLSRAWATTSDHPVPPVPALKRTGPMSTLLTYLFGHSLPPDSVGQDGDALDVGAADVNVWDAQNGAFILGGLNGLNISNLGPAGPNALSLGDPVSGLTLSMWWSPGRPEISTSSDQLQVWEPRYPVGSTGYQSLLSMSKGEADSSTTTLRLVFSGYSSLGYYADITNSNRFEAQYLNEQWVGYPLVRPEVVNYNNATRCVCLRAPGCLALAC